MTAFHKNVFSGTLSPRPSELTQGRVCDRDSKALLYVNLDKECLLNV